MQKGRTTYDTRVLSYFVLDPATKTDNIETNEQWDNKDPDATMRRYRISLNI